MQVMLGPCPRSHTIIYKSPKQKATLQFSITFNLPTNLHKAVHTSNDCPRIRQINLKPSSTVQVVFLSIL